MSICFGIKKTSWGLQPCRGKSMSFRFKLENGVKERRQWRASLHHHREVFYTVMRLSDLVVQSSAAFERHISGESFTAGHQNCPLPLLRQQRPTSNFRTPAFSPGVVSQKEEKNRPKSEPSFAIQSQFEMGRQAAGCVSQIGLPTLG